MENVSTGKLQRFFKISGCLGLNAWLPVAIKHYELFYRLRQHRVQGANHCGFKLDSHRIVFCRREVCNQRVRGMQCKDRECLSTFCPEIGAQDAWVGE